MSLSSCSESIVMKRVTAIVLEGELCGGRGSRRRCGRESVEVLSGAGQPQTLGRVCTAEDEDTYEQDNEGSGCRVLLPSDHR